MKKYLNKIKVLLLISMSLIASSNVYAQDSVFRNSAYDEVHCTQCHKLEGFSMPGEVPTVNDLEKIYKGMSEDRALARIRSLKVDEHVDARITTVREHNNLSLLESMIVDYMIFKE